MEAPAARSCHVSVCVSGCRQRLVQQWCSDQQDNMTALAPASLQEMTDSADLECVRCLLLVTVTSLITLVVDPLPKLWPSLALAQLFWSLARG